MAPRSVEEEFLVTQLLLMVLMAASRMLGYPTAFMACMFLVNRHFQSRYRAAALYPWFIAIFLLAFAGSAKIQAAPQQTHVPFESGGVAELSSSGPQARRGDLYIADGDVDIHYGASHLRADHVEYNNKTSDSLARGHVQFDFENQHIEADEANYNVKSGHGTFRNVRGTIKIERRPNPSVLLSDNPLYFEAREIERFPKDLYVIDHAWITICEPGHPTWQFFAPHARVQLDKSVAMVNANFRLFRVPLIWLPYASAPAGRKVRQSGFLIPDIGDSSRKGFTFGEAFYWAPKPWLDATRGRAVSEPPRSCRTWRNSRQAVRRHDGELFVFWRGRSRDCWSMACDSRRAAISNGWRYSRSCRGAGDLSRITTICRR